MTVGRISDAVFDERVTLRESYRIMAEFITRYHRRGETPTGDLFAYFPVCSDGQSMDPAALDDYLKCASAVLGRPLR